MRRSRSRLGRVDLSWNGASAEIAENGSSVVCSASVVHETVGEWIEYERRMIDSHRSDASSAASVGAYRSIQSGYVDLGMEEFEEMEEQIPVWDSNDYWLQKLSCVIADQPFKCGIGTIHQPLPICDHVYLGSTRTLQDPLQLTDLGITEILLCETKKSPENAVRIPYSGSPTGFCVKTLICGHDQPLIDTNYLEAESFLETVCLLGQKALVVCEDGINRGPALVVAYLMLRERMTLLEAVTLTKAKRLDGPVLWNQKLQLELIEFAREKELLS